MSETIKKTKAAAEVADPWKEMRTVRLRRAVGTEPKSVYVAVNGRAYNVPRGKSVEVPMPIYDVLMRQEEAMEALDDYRATIPKEGV